MSAAAKDSKTVDAGPAHARLIRDIKAKPESKARDALLKRAEAYEFHDDLSTGVMPKTALLYALSDAKYQDLIDKWDEGEYDDDDITLTAEEQVILDALQKSVAGAKPNTTAAS
jgi:hypothetical protein